MKKCLRRVNSKQKKMVFHKRQWRYSWRRQWAERACSWNIRKSTIVSVDGTRGHPNVHNDASRLMLKTRLSIIMFIKKKKFSTTSIPYFLREMRLATTLQSTDKTSCSSVVFTVVDARCERPRTYDEKSKKSQMSYIIHDYYYNDYHYRPLTLRRFGYPILSLDRHTCALRCTPIAYIIMYPNV